MQAVRAPLRLLFLGLLSVLQPASPSTAHDGELELLRLPETKYVVGLGAVAADVQVRALVDGNAETVAHLPTIDGAPADLVFDLGTIVAPSAVTIFLPTDPALSFPVRIDVLASETSPTSGFRSLKAEPLTGLEAEITFAIQPASARWLMIRLYPPNGASEVDVGVRGHPGPPETRYGFGETPAQAIEVLESLAALEQSTFEPDETEAVRIYDLALRDVPESALLQQNRDYAASKLP